MHFEVESWNRDVCNASESGREDEEEPLVYKIFLCIQLKKRHKVGVGVGDIFTHVQTPFGRWMKIGPYQTNIERVYKAGAACDLWLDAIRQPFAVPHLNHYMQAISSIQQNSDMWPSLLDEG